MRLKKMSRSSSLRSKRWEGIGMASISSANRNAQNVRVAYLLDCSGVVYQESVSFFVSEVKMFDLTDRSGVSNPLGQIVGLVSYARFKPYPSSST